MGNSSMPAKRFPDLGKARVMRTDWDKLLQEENEDMAEGHEGIAAWGWFMWGVILEQLHRDVIFGVVASLIFAFIVLTLTTMNVIVSFICTTVIGSIICSVNFVVVLGH